MHVLCIKLYMLHNLRNTFMYYIYIYIIYIYMCIYKHFQECLKISEHPAFVVAVFKVDFKF